MNKEDIKLYIAKLINEENENYSEFIKNIDLLLCLEPTQRLIEILKFSHKEKIDLLNKIYLNISG